MNGLFRLDWNDFFQALLASVIAPVFTAFTSMFNTCGFLSDCYDWAGLGKIAISAFFLFLSTKFVTDDSGKPLGIGSNK